VGPDANWTPQSGDPTVARSTREQRPQDASRATSAKGALAKTSRRIVEFLRRLVRALLKTLSTFRNRKTVPAAPPDRINLVVTGKVLEQGTDHKSILGARVRVPAARLSVDTGENGEFSITLLNHAVGKEVRLIILDPNHWPKTVKFSAGSPLHNLDPRECALEKVATMYTSGIPGLILGWFPSMVYYWYGRTRQEQRMLAVLLFMLMPPAASVAIDRGLPIPGTDWDEVVRERIQRIPWLPSKRPLVQFSKPRPRYFSGVRYRIAAGQYAVESPGIVIDQGAEVSIEPGAIFRMGRSARLLVRGKLLAEGNPGKEIQFLPTDPQTPWENITLWGEGSVGSVLSNWVVKGGTGTGVSGSDTGFLALADKGQKVGGGMLLFNTSVNMSNSRVESCTATFGGGLYMRNSPRFKNENLPGSRLTEVTLYACVAKGAEASAGGGIMVKNCYPEFRDCSFDENSSEGRFSCGGGAYFGVDSRGLLERCTFRRNRSEAEGGGLYGYLTNNSGDEHRSGVVITEHSVFEGNVAHGGGGGCYGYNSRFSLVNTTFQNNTTGTYLYQNNKRQASGGGVFLRYDRTYKSVVPCLIDDCIFESNQAEAPLNITAGSDGSFVGGALVVSTENRIKLVVTSLICKGNTARSGKHLAVSDNSLFDGWAGPGKWTQVPQFSDPGLNNKESVFVFPLKSTQPSPIAIRDDARLPPDCYGDRPQGVTISAVVIHYISAVEIKADDPYNVNLILNIFKGKPAERVAEKTSAHYLIERTGAIHRLVEESKRAWHAGFSALPSGEEDLNNFSIGIEMIRTPDDAPTEEQYEALASLLLLIKGNHPRITLNRIVGHDLVRGEWNRLHPERSAPKKEDPGPLFHWSRLMSRLSELRFDVPSS
jgi:AmpD protein